MSHIPAAATLLTQLLLPLLPALLPAQELGWDVKAEANASLFFGNTRQSTVATRLSAGRADSTFEVKSDGEFTYGEAETSDRQMYVNKRSWRAGLTGDYRPFARVSPFALAGVESSLEKRVDLRYNAGAGAKYVFVRSERTASDFSLALLGERSRLPQVTGVVTESTLARYLARFRFEHEPSERVVIAHETLYRPEAEAFDRFTFTSRTSLGYKLTTRLAVQLSFLDNYDSEARGRGARSNNDGEVLVGVVAAF
jgi:hypothetical protein